MLTSYLKLAFKILLRRKFYTLISVIGIALTLMVLIVVAAILKMAVNSNGVERNSNRFLHIGNMLVDRPGSSHSHPLGYGFIHDQLMTMKTPELVSAFTLEFQVKGFLGNNVVESQLRRTDANYWQIFQFDFIEGGAFTQLDNELGRRVAVINNRTRKKYFGEDSSLGKTITLNAIDYEIVGVVEDVGFPEVLATADIWIPIFSVSSTDFVRLEGGTFNAVILARNSSEVEIMKEEYTTMMVNYQKIAAGRFGLDETPGSAKYSFVASADNNLERFARLYFDTQFKGESGSKKMLWLIFLSAFLFMLLPAINLINLNISRILERSSEIGVRKSFGASSIVLVGQFIVENIVLTGIGGVFGFLLAKVVLSIISLSGIMPVPMSRFSMDYQVFAVGLVLIFVFALISGIYPAWKMARLEPVTALKGGQQ